MILNEIEGMSLPEGEPEDILMSCGVNIRSAFCADIGQQGFRYDDKTKRCTQGIFKVDVVDTTAAGDTFTGYFVHEITSGSAPEKHLK